MFGLTLICNSLMTLDVTEISCEIHRQMVSICFGFHFLLFLRDFSLLILAWEADL